MKRVYVMALAASLVAAVGTTMTAAEDDSGSNERSFRARLQAENELPAVISPAVGLFTAKVSEDGQSISYELSYSGLEGSVTQSHIHIGQKVANGGISIWLCSNLASPPTPPGVQPCPQPSGSISGTITAADVVGPVGQGIPPGNFADALAAIRGGLAYVNVHSSVSPGGELRGQIK